MKRIIGLSKGSFDRAISIVEEDIAIHKRWKRWQEITPEWETIASGVGPPEHHQTWINRYEFVREVLLEMERKIKGLRPSYRKVFAGVSQLPLNTASSTSMSFLSRQPPLPMDSQSKNFPAGRLSHTSGGIQ